jgi:hypothetical protein
MADNRKEKLTITGRGGGPDGKWLGMTRCWTCSRGVPVLDLVRQRGEIVVAHG